MAHQCHTAITNTAEWSDPHHSPSVSLDTICNTMNSTNVLSEKLTREKLLQCEDWRTWEFSEFKQLDQCLDQKIFGAPFLPPP